MTERITFAHFGETHTLDVVGECPETGSPLVELEGSLTAVSSLAVKTAEILSRCKPEPSELAYAMAECGVLSGNLHRLR